MRQNHFFRLNWGILVCTVYLEFCQKKSLIIPLYTCLSGLPIKQMCIQKKKNKIVKTLRIQKISYAILLSLKKKYFTGAKI
jgi:hypothetical protein